MSLPESLADRMLQYVRKVARQRRSGQKAGSDDWVMPLQRLDDLRDLPGFSDEIIQKLTPHLTVLPVDARTVNINSASPEVLEAVAPTWPAGSIRSFVAKPRCGAGQEHFRPVDGACCKYPTGQYARRSAIELFHRGRHHSLPIALNPKP